MNIEFIGKLAKIQQDLDAPKNQWNKFSNFWYRSCEDILEGLKPLLNGLVLTMSDDVILVGDRIYVKATVTLTDGENTMSNSALARESLTKKGMDDSQITGTASSYARKYALNGLFCIDDEKDADAKDNNQSQPSKPQNKSSQGQQQGQDDNKPWYNEPDYQADLSGITHAIKEGTPPDDVIKQISQKFKIATKYRDLIKAI
tara:strand:+ start:523 stop:1128 length:606 start_codon:yes stop_codon:yes gene_type:complete